VVEIAVDWAMYKR